MAQFNFGQGGANRLAKELYFGQGGNNLKVKEAWFGQGGVNRKVFSGVTYDLSFIATNIDPGFGTSTAWIDFHSDGTVAYTEGPGLATSGAWVTPNGGSVGSSYWIRFDNGAWLSLSQYRGVSLTGDNLSRDYSVALSTSSSGSPVVATGMVRLEVSNYT